MAERRGNGLGRARTAGVSLTLALTFALAAIIVPSPDAAVAPTVVRITASKGRPVGGIRRPVVKRGTVVRFVVLTDRGTGIHLHGYDIERTVRPGRRVVIQFTARIPGRFELELHKPDAVLAQLTVTP